MQMKRLTCRFPRQHDPLIGIPDPCRYSALPARQTQPTDLKAPSQMAVYLTTQDFYRVR